MKKRMRTGSSLEKFCAKCFWQIFVPLVLLLATQEGSSALVSEINATNWQVFLDDFVVDRATGLDRVVHHPRSRGLAIPADKPWETFGCYPHYVGRKSD